MLRNKKIQVAIGASVLLFSCFAMVAQRDELLSVPLVQYVIGFITVTMLLSGISAFRQGRKKAGILFTFIAVSLFCVAFLNYSVTIEGFIALVAICVIATIPFIIFFTVTNLLKNKNKL